MRVVILLHHNLKVIKTYYSIYVLLHSFNANRLSKALSTLF
jgi:hypothetical protein